MGNIQQASKPRLDSPLLGKTPVDVISANMRCFGDHLKCLQDDVERRVPQAECDDTAFHVLFVRNLCSNAVETYGTLFEAVLGPEAFSSIVKVYNYIENDGNVFTAHFATHGYE